jgi:hypothetical protein
MSFSSETVKPISPFECETIPAHVRERERKGRGNCLYRIEAFCEGLLFKEKLLTSHGTLSRLNVVTFVKDLAFHKGNNNIQ